ncbi:hypothetical protein EMPS_09965 [Entomortierella parvispora]|uniref:Histone H1 n=1 Tax=Entomortierella parvispora TaxID=205924 RepID=A0A9P3M0J4_9FUNG|nr:hypothetical protein EMPS_09965 [Entomortierella parvispora]
MSADNTSSSSPPSSLEPSVSLAEQASASTRQGRTQDRHRSDQQPLLGQSSQTQLTVQEDPLQQQGAAPEMEHKHGNTLKRKIEQGPAMPSRHQRSRGPAPKETVVLQASDVPINNPEIDNPEPRQTKTRTRRLTSREPATEPRLKKQSLLAHPGVMAALGPRQTPRNTVPLKQPPLFSNARGAFVGRRGNSSTLSRYSSGLDAIRHNKDKKGATRSAIKLFIGDKYCPKWDSFEERFNDAVKRGVKEGIFKYTNNNNTRLAVIRPLTTKTAKHDKISNSAQLRTPQSSAASLQSPSLPHSQDISSSSGVSHSYQSGAGQNMPDSAGISGVNATTDSTTEETSRRLRSRSGEIIPKRALPHKKR